MCSQALRIWNSCRRDIALQYIAIWYIFYILTQIYVNISGTRNNIPGTDVMSLFSGDYGHYGNYRRTLLSHRILPLRMPRLQPLELGYFPMYQLKSWKKIIYFIKSTNLLNRAKLVTTWQHNGPNDGLSAVTCIRRSCVYTFQSTNQPFPIIYPFLSIYVMQLHRYG